MYSRADLSRTVAIVVALFLTAASTSAVAREFRAADTQSEDYPTVQALRYMGRLIAERSGGRLQIRVFHSRQLGEEKETIEQTRVGAIDLNRTNVALIGTFVPAMNVLAMPFLFRSIEHLQKVLDGPIGNEILGSFEPYGFVGLAFYNSGARSIYNSVRPVRSLADMKGLRLRVQQSELMSDMIRALGAEPVELPYGQVLTGLATRLIDGAENNWPSFVTTDHYKYAGYYTLTEHTMSPEVLVMSQKAWESLSADDQKTFPRGRGPVQPVHARASGRISSSARASRRRPPASTIVTDFDRKPFEAAMAGIYAKAQRDPAAAATDRTHSQGGVNWSWQRPSRTKLRNGRRASPRAAVLASSGWSARCRSAGASCRSPALNSAVVVVLAAMIWNGAQVLGSAWDDVRQVRESDKILALLESETGRLQNLIHRYINQPSPELFAEILLLREAVLGTLTTRASTDPMLSGSVEELERVTERFLNGFGELRAVQATISKTYEEQVLAPARDMAGLYSIIEGATGHRDALIWPSLGKSREAFTAMLVAANAYYLSLATRIGRGSPPEHRDDRENHSGDDRPCRQRPAAHGAAAVEHADGGAARGPCETVRAARQPHRAVAQYHRRQPGRRHRRHRRFVGQDAPARAEGAGDVRPDAGRHLPQGAVDRGDLSRHHHHRRRR